MRENRIYKETMGKDVRDWKIANTVTLYNKEIKRLSGAVDKKQTQFAKDVLLEFYKWDNDKINKITARCGMGKSELIKSFLYNLVNDEKGSWGKSIIDKTPHPFGAIIVTDKLERLESITKYKGLETRCYFMKWDNKDTATQERKEFKDQLKEQYKYPILLMTTQKYFRMSKEERNSIYKWYQNGEKLNREICIFDERPILTSATTVNEEFLSSIAIELDKISDNNKVDKNYLIDNFEIIRNEINRVRKGYSDEHEVMWIKSSRTNLFLNIEEDKKFFNTLENYVSYDILDKCNKLKEIFVNGALFVNKKRKEGKKLNDENARNIILLKDNIECFDIEKCKYHILDATAKYDFDYIIDKDYFKDIKIDDVKDIKDIDLIHIPISTSQYTFKKEANNNINPICTWINKSFKENECFVATYGNKSGIYNKFNQKINQDNIGYFGNIKGSNEHESKNTMIHLGLNRQSDIVYLQSYILWRRKNTEWNSMDNEDISKEIDGLLEMEKGLFVKDAMNYIMELKLLVDTEQNIFRIKCRHFSNKEECRVYMVTNFNKMFINKLGIKIGANIKEEMPAILQKAINEEKLLSRKAKNGKKTAPQILQEYLSNLDKGTIIKTSEILNGSGLNREEFKNAKKSKVLKDWFANHKCEKAGLYII